MSNSSTSEISNLNIEYQDSEGENLEKKKNITTDTDYYFNLVANPSKIKPTINNIESSEIIEELNDSNTSKASSKKSHKASSHSSKKSSESKPIYDKININNVSEKLINNSYSNPLLFLNKTNNLQDIKNVSETKPPNLSRQNTETRQFNSNKIPKLVTEPIQGSNISKNAPTPIAVATPIINESNYKILQPHEIKIKKIELLRKLSEIKAKGYQLSKDYDFNSTIDEMEYEYELVRSFADKRNGVKIFRNSLLQAVSVVEFLNDKYDPFDFHLSGWSEHVSIEIESWEDVLEEIYEKYKGSGRKMAPEIKLLYLMIASASAFHFTRAHSSKLPGLDSLLAANPSLLSNIINSKKDSSQFMTQQELNIEKQKEELKNKEKNDQNKYINQLQEQIKNQQQIINNNKHNENNNFTPSGLPNFIPKETLNKTSIRAPEQVKDILNRLHNIKPTNTETQDDISSNNDRLISDTTISDNNQKKSGRKSRKNTINIL